MTRPGTAGRVAAAGLVALLGAVAVPAPARAVEEGQWWHETWRTSDVWSVTDGAGVTVAVIDTGVDASISELDGAVVPGVDLTGLGGDGMVDHDEEDDGHGTGMASLIAGRGGDSGLRGVAPGVEILPVTASVDLESRDAVDRYPEAIRAAVDGGAQVINMSLGGYRGGSCPAQVATAVREAARQDVVVVAATGNDAGGETAFPGNCPGVVTVGAVDQDLAPWEDSHRSAHVDVAAPGVEISLIARGGVVGYGSGTSSSAALVSGTVALIRAEFPEAPAREVVARLLATVRDVGEPGRDDATGYGLVRPYEALTESVPADAPNPVFDALGDLSEEFDPTPPPTGPAGPPELPEPVLSSDDDSEATTVLVVLGSIGAVLLIAAVVVVLLVVRLRGRRSPRHHPAGPPPPGMPGPPPPPR